MAGTSEPGTSCTAENTPAGSAYDVLVSFRGPDTRYDITDVLYVFMKDKGICVFRDTEEIRHGEEIGDELRRAVPDSRIYVVVFSKDYASSAWCLRELAMMVDCCRDSASGKVIFPIFYEVTPDDVKLKTDLYRGALNKHRHSEKYNEEELKKWEETLKKVGGISGPEYKRDMGKGEFVSAVVADILNKLNIKDRSLPDHLVGMDDCVEKVMGLLNFSSQVERQVMLVHGMGGIGKTTLAEVIFNRISSQFNGSCFLADVRESMSTGVGGVERLQKKLLRDIFGKSDGEIGDSSDGMNEIQRRLRNRRVLIIFDDVSESSQLKKLVGNFNFFGPGTIIIVTTRDKSICEGLMRPSDIAYEVEGMSYDHALQLFSWHAFGGEVPPNDFVDLSKWVIRMTGNLPLALEVIGGHLFQKEKNKWEHTLEKLERVPHKNVLYKLRISYDDLDESEKQIFLDIACFDNHVMPRKYASYMWEACGFFPKNGLDVLQNRSLIKVLNVDDEFEDKYWMHDLIREMGREIGKRGRLWYPELPLNVILQKQGTDQVLAIDLRGSYELLTGDEFDGMSNLRFLAVEAELSGIFRNIRTNLLWLYWEVKLCPYFFQMDSLVILQISGVGITEDSMKDMRMDNLRVLNISNVRITRLPDLSRFPKLEIIDLRFCWQLEEIHSSIGRLGDLRILRGIETSIRKLPSSIGNLKNLEVLELLALPTSFRFPMSRCNLSGLASLQSLTLIGLDVNVEGIDKLYGLQKLKLDVGGILSTNLGSMSRLEDLYLYNSNISSELQLTSSLRILTLMRCWQSMHNGTSLDGPSNIGNMSYPIKLLDLGSLRRLSYLKLSACDRIDFSGIERMELLEELRVWDCVDFVGEITDLSNLRRLKRVEFYRCDSLINVPRMAGDCHLMINNCRELESFEGPYRQYHNKRKMRRSGS